MELKERRELELHNNDFFRWFRSQEGDDPQKKLDITPIMVVFVMNFRDMNKWVIRFSKNKNPYCQIINGNTFEDETHSFLFIEDWVKLGFDEKSEWKASDVLWWLFKAKQTEPFRRYGMEFIKLSIDDADDPMLRFAYSEIGEACGHVFLLHSVSLAKKLEQKTGINYRYFNHFHLDRELGHVMESEGVFENVVLSEYQQNQSLLLGNRMFDIFDGIFKAFYEYGMTYASKGKISQKSDNRAITPIHLLGYLPSRIKDRPKTKQNEKIYDYLHLRKINSANHSFYTYIKEESSLTAKEKLQGFIPMWCMDILGYSDINQYLLEYENPISDKEKSLNDWSRLLKSHSDLFMDDWVALGLDDFLGWNSSETLQFLFYDQYMNIHRRNSVLFSKLAIRYTLPEERFWLMEALESSGEEFFNIIKEIAKKAEIEDNITLNYLSDRHSIPYEDKIKNPIIVDFLEEDSSEEIYENALDIIKTVFDALDEHLAISLQVLKNNSLKKP